MAVFAICLCVLAIVSAYANKINQRRMRERRERFRQILEFDGESLEDEIIYEPGRSPSESISQNDDNNPYRSSHR